MAIEMQLDNVDAWEAGGGILPPGKHVCTITDAKQGESRNGHPQIELRAESVDPQAAGAGIRDWVVITPNSMGRVKQLLEAAGISIPSGSFNFDPAQLEGKRVTLYVAVGRKPDGSEKNEVTGYASPQESDLPADTSGLPTGNGSGASRQDEDIPF